jgi:hypothetical protein
MLWRKCLRSMASPGTTRIIRGVLASKTAESPGIFIMIIDGCDFVVVRTQGLQGDRGCLKLHFRNRADEMRVVCVAAPV